ncbi:PA14 domain-containing protein [Spirulina sp. 06S082]|uniref:PA14 domain-containing protein n=1 Tax=Spirulina sp. 06S082 TaxID=3110248 RepID=UPI002B1F3D92|nr:PA14 domain-containing protein [Spirulina sp. 06S082]MEA5469100.1 PA14 domain-containing protein [Spirulina sp. 06S082]
MQQESDRLTLTLNGETITAELNGTGLRGEYYNREDFGQPQTSRIDPNLNFLWGLGTPAWGSVGADRFSIRWTGWLEAPSSETYDLTLEANGRSRIWLQNPATGEWHKLLDTWNQGDPNSITTHNLTIPFPLQQSTHYPIKIEYQDDIGEASLNLKWESPSRPLETIPSTYLHPGEHPLPGTSQTGTGLKVKHYHHPDFGLLGGENNQNSQILHDWGNQGSIWSVTPPDGHSSIWTGRIEAPTSETYQFHTHADGRTRVWIKDQQGEWHKILEGWEEDTGGIRERTGTVPFEFSAGNQYEIKIEYQDDTGNSSIETLWESPSRSPEVIPTQFLYADDLSEEPGVQAQGTGPKANYYLHQDFSQKRFTWQENEANRDWGGHSPSYLDMPPDGWSGIWTGQIEAPSTDIYNISTRADGKVRFWLREPGGEWQELIEDWEEDPNTSQLNTSPGVFLEAGVKYDFKAEFQEEIGDADLELLWESGSRTREVIPTKYIYGIEPEYAPEVQAAGTGVNALYFNSTEPSSTANLGGVPQRVDMEWYGGNPVYGSLPNDNWSARFTGKLEAPYSEDFTLTTRANGGSRVWVRDPNTNTWYKIIENWSDSNSSVDIAGEIPFRLQAGVKYDFQVDYKDEVGDAQLKLLWESDSRSLGVIPQEFLYPEQLTIPVGVEGQGTGLKGDYFNNEDFTDWVTSRTDAEVDFAWGNGSPDEGMDADTYSARWTGQIEPLYDEDYTFYSESDDGVRLWVNGVLAIDHWQSGDSQHNSQPISLEAGQKYDIKLEYFEDTGDATAKLLWSSNSQVKETIPSSQLYPAEVLASWSGEVTPQFDEDYTFEAFADFPVRLIVNGEVVLDNFADPDATSVTLPLQAGETYQIELESLVEENLGYWTCLTFEHSGGGSDGGSGGGSSDPSSWCVESQWIPTGTQFHTRQPMH